MSAALSAALVAAFGLFVLSGSPAHAAVFPACHDAPVEMRILRDFNWAEENTWRRGVDLVRLDRMHEHRTVQKAGSQVTRRYCNATAILSNGTRRQIWYMIEDIGGFAGYTWEVTHCVSGLDPWKNHDGYCRTMR
ncbi:MAG: hypothetical protein KDJ80_00365 [Nitratireductor sp.]|nr:hypothetical protein [Nitratireductor sp.]